MQRMKMAVGIVVGAVLLQLAFMACSGNGTPGFHGGNDAAAQSTCTQWEIKGSSLPFPREATMIEAGWEPFNMEPLGSGIYVLTRRCVAR